jgi:hypothetical protein
MGSGLLDNILDLLVRGWLLEADDEVDNGDILSRYSERQPALITKILRSARFLREARWR